MSVNLAWDAEMTIKSSYGVVTLNEIMADPDDSFPPKWLYLVQNDTDDYSIVPAKFRAVSDSLSQGDGSSIQPPWIDGLLASMSIGFWVCPNGERDAAEPACDDDLREMNEFLMGVLNGLRTFPTDVSTQQYAWQPPGAAFTRILEGVMLAAWPTPDFSHGPKEVRLKVQIASPYPYALENDLITTSISAGGSAVVTNGGNSPGLPIVFVKGPASSCAVVNLSSGFTISYDSTRPGAHAILMGDILQIDCAEGTCLLNGDPDFDYIAGLDPAATDLWPLLPNGPSSPNGDQTVTVAGADVDIKHYWYWL